MHELTVQGWKAYLLRNSWQWVQLSFPKQCISVLTQSYTQYCLETGINNNSSLEFVLRLFKPLQESLILLSGLYLRGTHHPSPTKRNTDAGNTGSRKEMVKAAPRPGHFLLNTIHGCSWSFIFPVAVSRLVDGVMI